MVSKQILFSVDGMSQSTGESDNIPEADESLERPYPVGLGDLDEVDTQASDGQVLIRRRDLVERGHVC